ncbi:MAG: 2-oxo acid dehydrogenase subunit E2, partial [Alcaligenaceae bacterium]|nr:2-oxo acid dehydrogenase subunit E2 [Alcaligenaceae bacterium]
VQAAQPGGNDRPLASPAVRRRAMDAGIDLQAVPASGAQGQVTQQDLDNWLQQSGAAAAAGGAAPAPSMAFTRREGVEDIPVVGLRRKIAERMQQSKRHIPHFTYVEEVDVTELETLRQKLNERWGEARGRLTLLPFLARAMVLAINDFPQMNARYDDEKGVVSRHAPVHLGVAAQTDSGLMVPVLRHAEACDLWACANEIRRLAQAARNGSAHRDELSGSTITLTSLGALGGIVSTPVINYPEVAIVGVNRVVEKPVVRNGVIVVRKTMNLSSSFDHRVVDGMHAAEFIQCIRELLECPSLLFVQ